MTEITELKPKSFWKKPEGVTGIIFAVAGVLGGGYLLHKALPFIIGLLSNTLHAALLLLALGVILYILLDRRFRTLIFFVYKSIMRFITKLFVEIDPIGILETYVEDLRNNLSKMNEQISNLRGQMRKLKDVIDKNKREMNDSLRLASKAKEAGRKNIMILKSRKAGRLKESNITLEKLYTRMEVLYRVLSKMYENAEILLEDIVDEVDVRKREREAIRAGHSAFRSAMKIISGDKDKRAMFDAAMEAIADDVGKKIGEMERFMEISKNFMDSIDLQNGVYEEDGLNLLEQWEKESSSLLLGDQKRYIIEMANDEKQELDLDAPVKPERKVKDSQYGKLFDF